MTAYVIAHATRPLAADDPRRPRQTIESLTELPDPNVPGSGGVSWLSPRTIQIPGFSGGHVWDRLDAAERFPTKAAARAKARQLRGGALIVDLDTATDYERRRHLARARAKARKI
jgi:hypothetical protein